MLTQSHTGAAHRFQLVAISALRAAMLHTLPRVNGRKSPSDPAKAAKDKEMLQPVRFADITAGACSTAEVCCRMPCVDCTCVHTKCTFVHTEQHAAAGLPAQ